MGVIKKTPRVKKKVHHALALERFTIFGAHFGKFGMVHDFFTRGVFLLAMLSVSPKGFYPGARGSSKCTTHAFHQQGGEGGSPEVVKI